MMQYLPSREKSSQVVKKIQMSISTQNHVKKQNPAIRQSFIIYNVPPKKWHLFLNLIIWFQNVFFFSCKHMKKGEKANATFLGTPCSPVACNIIQAFFYENEELNFHLVIRNRKIQKFKDCKETDSYQPTIKSEHTNCRSFIILTWLSKGQLHLWGLGPVCYVSLVIVSMRDSLI